MKKKEDDIIKIITCQHPDSSFKIYYLNKSNIKKEKDKKNDICDDALNELVKLGYMKSYVRECLNNNEKNYATTSYFLFVKYCY